MTRKLVLLFSLLIVLLLSACSYGYFAVVNRSAGVIEVQYSLKRHAFESGKSSNIEPPAKVSLKEFEKAEYEWRRLPPEQYRFDNLTGTFIVSLDPGEVMLVEHVVNYVGDENQFAIASIKIRGENGSIDLEGKQAQRQFRSGPDTKYLLTYR